jgi:hypothetical protein
MDHIAIDLGGLESQICVRGPDGQVLEEVRQRTARLGSYLKKRPPARVILETCAEAFRVADAALELGHEVRVVPATLVGSLGVGSRGVKTDRRDAQILSEVSTRIDLPSVHIRASCLAPGSLPARPARRSCHPGSRQLVARFLVNFRNFSGQLLASGEGLSLTEAPPHTRRHEPRATPLRATERLLGRSLSWRAFALRLGNEIG